MRASFFVGPKKPGPRVSKSPKELVHAWRRDYIYAVVPLKLQKDEAEETSTEKTDNRVPEIEHTTQLMH